MLRYLVRRILLMIPTLVAISILAFLIIQLPPGDFLSAYVAEVHIIFICLAVKYFFQIDLNRFEFLRSVKES